MKRMTVFAQMALLLVASGCGARTATISGKVSYKGRPVTSGGIVVLNPDGQTIVKGTIQPDGTYSVDGVKPGSVKIGILSPNPTPALKTKDSGWFPLPRELGNPGTSGLTCDVTAPFLEHNIAVK